MASSESSPRRSSQASRASATSRGGGGVAGCRHHAAGDRLDEEIGPGRVVVGPAVASSMSNSTSASGLGDGDAAVAAGAVEDAAQQIDVGLRYDRRARASCHRAAGRCRDHGVLDLLEGEAHQALRHPAGLVEDVDQQLELGLAVDPAIPGDALDQPLRVLGGQVALGLGLLDQVVGDGLDEAVGPGRVLHGAGIVQGEDDVGLLGGDAAVIVIVAAQLEDIGVLDAAARLDFRDRDRVQHCHSQPPANPVESYGVVVTIRLMPCRA